MDDRPQGDTTGTPGQPEGSCLGLGCGIVAAALAIGFVVFIVTDAVTSCGGGSDCDGNPDAAFMDTLQAAITGGYAFIASLIVITLVVYVVRLLRRPPGQHERR